MELTNRTIVITGGTSGIGLEMAKQLLALGNTVIATGRDDAKRAAVSSEVTGLRTVRCDISDPGSIHDLVAELERIAPHLDVLINNAGIMRFINLQTQDAPSIDIADEIETNFTGTVRVTAALLPLLSRRPEAAIVNVSSGLAYVPLPAAPVYSATKAALHSYTQSLRAQLEGTRVSVFEILPPATSTPMLDRLNGGDTLGSTTMPVEDMVAASIEGLRKNRPEIAPGQSSQLRFMDRVAPRFIRAQLAKSTTPLLSAPTLS